MYGNVFNCMRCKAKYEIESKYMKIRINGKMNKGHEIRMPRQKECEKGTDLQIKIA